MSDRSLVLIFTGPYGYKAACASYRHQHDEYNLRPSFAQLPLEPAHSINSKFHIQVFHDREQKFHCIVRAILDGKSVNIHHGMVDRLSDFTIEEGNPQEIRGKLIAGWRPKPETMAKAIAIDTHMPLVLSKAANM